MILKKTKTKYILAFNLFYFELMYYKKRCYQSKTSFKFKG